MALRKIRPEDVSLIVKLYKENRLSTHQIAPHFGVTSKTIYYHLKRAGVELRDRHVALRKITIAQQDAVVASYRSGKSSGELAKGYGVSDVTILKVLEDAGIPRRSLSLAHRKYPLNDSAFHEITDESAYWAGFLMADGCVQGTILQVGLSARDKHHLEKLRAFLNTTSRPIYEYQVCSCGKSYDVAALKVRSGILTARLRELGIIERKSLRATASEELAMHQGFWHGMIDGDGWLGADRVKDIPCVSLCGGEALLNQYSSFICSWLFPGFRPMVEKPKKSKLCRVSLWGAKAYIWLELLYPKAPYSLDRKRNLALQILKEYCCRYEKEANRWVNSSFLSILE